MSPIRSGSAINATGRNESAYSNLRAATVDRMHAALLLAEWLGLILAAVVLSPFSWAGEVRSIHPHVWMALLSGPSFILPVVWLVAANPARPLTRHAIAIAQMLVSAILVDVTGGRIETHFHIFGALAFLAFYRDWKVLVTASAVTSFTHLAGAILWPHALYGVLSVSPWRWMEHTCWVIFEDIFLVLGGMRERSLEWGAHHDALTGLANRILLRECFHSLPAGGNVRRALLFIDLDHFKQANDTLGHAVGDELLISAGRRLCAAAGPHATIARMGGDEFVVLVDGAGESEAVAAARRILQAVSAPVIVDEHELLLSASVGIALSPDHGSDLATLQECADRAMYAAKKQGRNMALVFFPEIDARDQILTEIGRDLYHALSRGQLRLDFQPLICRDSTVAGFEALLRWSHPIHGPIAPSEVIPIAERAGLIASIGDWVLTEACQECRLWQQNGQSPIGVAVNVSSLQLEQPEFPRRVAAILGDIGLDPALLTLELPEGFIFSNLGSVSPQLIELRSLGVRIALDDFGTGFSSLSILTSIPADIIKLDKSFLPHDRTGDTSAIRSVFAVARRIGLRVIAEGVETQAQSEWLNRMDCDELQGYYLSKPIPAGEVGRFLEGARDASASLRAIHSSLMPSRLQTATI